MSDIGKYIEALIFASDKSISVDEIRTVLEEVVQHEISSQVIQTQILAIQENYSNLNIAVELVNQAGGYQFLTRKEYYPVIQQLQMQRSKKKLSQAALETLSIIAYKQPVTKVEIEQIRGVNCDYSVQKLLEKELISIIGKSDSVGKPLLYGTSTSFMDYFGINTPADLPKLSDLQNESNTVGEISE